jgi:LPS-assembly protein
VQITADDKLVATGNVEAMFEGRRLKAHSITYDSTTETLSIKGPMALQDGDETLILADQAELDRDMANGLLTGARIVMNTQVQLAANAMARIDGRYSQLYKVSVTSCRICETGQPPLWQIRARRVIHDQEERQLYFDDAQLRVLDVPILYLPRLRLPDPTLDRATGFLFPSFYNSSLLGNGIKVPYFIRLGDHRDLTLTPFVTDKTRTLELRYRQAFVNGDLTINGAISDDDLGVSSTRGYLFAEGEFELKNDFKLSFDIEYTSVARTHQIDALCDHVDHPLRVIRVWHAKGQRAGKFMRQNRKRRARGVCGPCRVVDDRHRRFGWQMRRIADQKERQAVPQHLPCGSGQFRANTRRLATG